MSSTVLALRLVVAALLGMALGFERELRGQPAGLRTHILVGLGACLFAMTGAYAFQSIGGPGTEREDLTRVASQVVVGIGFLGGGAILRHGTSILGLTTAANLWVTAAIGVACAAGFFAPAALTTLLTLIALVGLRPVEGWLYRNQLRDHISQPAPERARDQKRQRKI